MAESRFISNGQLLLEADVAELERLHQEIKALPDAEALCIWLHTTIPLRWHENLTVATPAPRGGEMDGEQDTACVHQR